MKQWILKLYNSESRKLEEILPSLHPYITLYTCGPTVYDFAHIGNFRTYIFEDLLKRTLLLFGYSVRHVMNITDVDDKTIKGAIKKNMSLEDYTSIYKKAFFEDLDTLKILKADFYPEAVKYISQMIEIIQNLLDKKIAYVAKDKSIYFSIDKCSSYGKLSHLNLSELKSSGRISSDEYEKEGIGDFVLWKAYDPKRDGNIFWESPFGPGRPGWHIECSAMSHALLGETLDIHCGGIDNMFPHHENEIAQSEAFTGKPFVLHWAHSEHLLVDNKKMSKSLGNFYTLRDLMKKGYTGLDVRFALLQTHYRIQQNFTMHSLDSAKSALQRIKDFIYRLKTVNNPLPTSELTAFIDRYYERFCLALSDDLNISEANAVLFDLIKEINIYLDEEKVTDLDVNQIFILLKRMNQIFGYLPLEEKEEEIPQEVQELFQKRLDARNQKDFAKADLYRKELLEKGWAIEDSKKGSFLKKL
jgi:cysteinyl-tRNA synthetase